MKKTTSIEKSHSFSTVVPLTMHHPSNTLISPIVNTSLEPPTYLGHSIGPPRALLWHTLLSKRCPPAQDLLSSIMEFIASPHTSRSCRRWTLQHISHSMLFLAHICVHVTMADSTFVCVCGLIFFTHCLPVLSRKVNRVYRGANTQGAAPYSQSDPIYCVPAIS